MNNSHCVLYKLTNPLRCCETWDSHRKKYLNDCWSPCQRKLSVCSETFPHESLCMESCMGSQSQTVSFNELCAYPKTSRSISNSISSGSWENTSKILFHASKRTPFSCGRVMCTLSGREPFQLSHNQDWQELQHKHRQHCSQLTSTAALILTRFSPRFSTLLWSCLV